MLLPRSTIFLCDDIESFAQELQIKLSQNKQNRVVLFVKEKFLVEDAKAVIAEAYISETDIKYIILGAYEFNIYSQNALLKILEEPPKNIVFYLLTTQKSALLPTIRSRLVVENKKQKISKTLLDINLKKLDLEAMYQFLQTYKDLSKLEAKELISSLLQTAIIQGVDVNDEILHNFETAYKLLDLNTKVIHVLSFLLMGFLYANNNVIK